MQRLTMKISGMSCGHCVASVSKALQQLDGVTVDRVAVGQAVVEFDPATTPVSTVTDAVEGAGYSVTATE